MNTPQDEWLGPMTDAVTKRFPSPDILVHNAGTLFLFCPLTQKAKQWIADNVQPDATWFGNALVVEHRYAWALGQGMRDAGLQLE